MVAARKPSLNIGECNSQVQDWPHLVSYFLSSPSVNGLRLERSGHFLSYSVSVNGFQLGSDGFVHHSVSPGTCDGGGWWWLVYDGKANVKGIGGGGREMNGGFEG